MRVIFNRIYPKVLPFTFFILLSTIVIGQNALNFESRKFKSSQAFTYDEIIDNIKQPLQLDATLPDNLSKKLDSLIQLSQRQLSHGKYIVKEIGPNLVGNLDTLTNYIASLSQIKSDYLTSLAKDLSIPDNANEYGEIYNKAKSKIDDFEKVLGLALKNQENTLATGIPEIDGLSSRLSPSMKIAGEFSVKNTLDVSGNVFIGNNLNDETNNQVIYNANSSTYGVILLAKGNLFKTKDENLILAGNLTSSFTEKSLFRDSTTSINFNMFDIKLGLELIFYKGFSFYWGRNYNKILDNVEEFSNEIDFKVDATSESLTQSFSNIGFRGQYSFTDKKEYSLAFDVNAIILDDDLKSTLKTKDPYLLILKLSLTKSLF